MNTSEPTIEIVSQDALGIKEIPPNSSSLPKHVEGKARKTRPNAFAPGVESTKTKASVNYLRLLGGTQLKDGRFRKCMVKTERLTIYHCDVAAYTKITVHNHVEEEFGYICRGAMSLDLDGESHVLYEGDSYFIPSDMPYALTALYISRVVKVLSKS
jgi:mannose-6-phosphate isomerase-like protein (cupin superfamily)